MVSPFDLAGRHILVTGATAGIGRATAVALAGLGARITATGRDEVRLAETLDRLAGEGHRGAAFDLADADAIPAWVKTQAETGGPFDGVAHCAGVQSSRLIRHVDRAFFDGMMHVNLLSALMLGRGYRQKGCHPDPGSGAMVLVSSLASMIGPPSNVVYAATKGGLDAAMRGMAIEFLRDRIRVNAVAPAMIDTEMTVRFRQTMTDEQFAALNAKHPMGFGAPEDVANAIAFLLSGAARWINGVVLPLDGGALVI